jgi:hypothetical protein
MVQQKVADLTTDELRAIIREAVLETLSDLLEDPDEGLELREDVALRLEASIKALEAGEPTISAEEADRLLGLP